MPLQTPVVRSIVNTTPPYGRRSGSSDGLQRRVLDLYAKRRHHRLGGGIGGVVIIALLTLLLIGWGGIGKLRGEENSLMADRFERLVEEGRGERSSDVEVGGKEDEEEEDKEEKVLGDELVGLEYITRRDVPADHVSLKRELNVPAECEEWRKIARNESVVHPYREHFTSLDVTDWFTYVAFFDELFHAKAVKRHRRPRYLDIAANHAKRWSATWFYDRCMGWDGVCVEANPKYYAELTAERHCHVVKTCMSDSMRKVKFAMTDAYGGVVKGEKEQFGVDGAKHATLDKYKGSFEGVKELTCTTVKKEAERLGMAHFEFMSLDVEGHELPILRGVDWERVTIDVIVTENRSGEVRRLLEEQGYELYENILKDFLYVRKESKFVPQERFVKLMKRLNSSTYRFTTTRT